MDTLETSNKRELNIRWLPSIAMTAVGGVIGLLTLFVLGFFLHEYDKFYVFNFVAGCVFSAVIGGFLKRSVQLKYTWIVLCGFGWVASGIADSYIFTWSGYHIERGFLISSISSGVIIGSLQCIVLYEQINVLKWVSVNIVARLIISGFYLFAFGSLINWGSW